MSWPLSSSSASRPLHRAGHSCQNTCSEPTGKRRAAFFSYRNQQQSQEPQSDKNCPKAPRLIFDSYLVVARRQLDSDKTWHQHHSVRLYPVNSGPPVWMIRGFQHQQAVALHGDVSSKEITAYSLREHCASRWAGRGFALTCKAALIFYRQSTE